MSTTPSHISNEAFFGGEEEGDDSSTISKEVKFRVKLNDPEEKDHEQLQEEDPITEEEEENVKNFLSRRMTFVSLYETLSSHAKTQKPSILQENFFLDQPDIELSSQKDASTPKNSDKGLLGQLLEFVLKENGLDHCIPVFQKEEIDLDAFLKLNNQELQEIGFKQGLRKKLLYLQTVLQEVIQEESHSELNLVLSDLRNEKPKVEKEKKKKKKKKNSTDDFNLKPRSSSSKKEELFPEPDFETKPVIEQVEDKTLAGKNFSLSTSKIKAEVAQDIKSEEIIEDDTMRGWLWKQGGHIKSWKRRYCVLSNNCLYYFTAPGSKAKGMVPLLGYEVFIDKEVLPKPFSFILGHQTVRSYYFYAETKQEATAWISALEQAVKSK